MKKFHYYGILVIVVLLTGTALALKGPVSWQAILWRDTPNVTTPENITEYNLETIIPHHQEITLGIYDLNQDFQTNDFVAIDHYFIDWNNYSYDDLLTTITTTYDNNRWAMITIEPFLPKTLPSVDLLSEIVDGEYNEPIIEVCNDIGSLDVPVFIRFMHEMDQPANAARYPWVTTDGKLFIQAYQHFINLCRPRITEAYYVWSPIGSAELAQYYPGDSYVDIIGLSQYSFPQWEQLTYGEPLGFRQTFASKYNIVKTYQKPVMIAELGIARDKTPQRDYFIEIESHLSEFPLLQYIVYFDAIEPFPEGWGLPSDEIIDWRLEDISDFSELQGY